MGFNSGFKGLNVYY